MEFKQRSLSLVILLYLATGGLYGVYWIARNGYSMNATDVGRRAVVLTSAMLALLLVFVFTVGYEMSSVATHEMSGPILHFERFFVLAAVCAVLLYLLAAILSALIATRIRAQSGRQLDEGCSPVTAVVLTIFGFTSAIYLQYHINSLLRK